MSLLEVTGLRTEIDTARGRIRPVDGVSFAVRAGETLGVVGESGSGKTMTGMSIMRLLPPGGSIAGGSIRLDGRELTELDEPAMRKVRGSELAMIFQDPMTSMNPVYKVGDQISEQILAHRDVSKAEAKERSIELLKAVGIPGAEERVDNYPHEFSGGMRQRAMIAMGLSLEPPMLIADEPTTALDVTIQAQILRLLKQLNTERGLAVILITHDLGVVADIADRVMVMYAGRVVETGTLDQIFYEPQHPYTWGLLGSIMRLDRPRGARLAQIKGQPPSLIEPPEGCHFRPRCPHAFSRCTEKPELAQRSGSPGHLDRCWLSGEQKKTLRTLESGDIGLEDAAA
jgi:peptide/nickel transport system ATP-binding protein